MTGDRGLTPHEKRMFMSHTLNASEIVLDGGGEPSLYDVALIEILGRLEGHQKLIVDLGRKIQLLDERLTAQEEEA